MITSRLLVVLCFACRGDEMRETIDRALENAVRPTALRFAVPDAAPGEEWPEGTLLFHAGDGWQDVERLLTDETHFLLLGAPYAFAPRWDALLLRQLRALGGRALLTGSLTPCRPRAVVAESAANEPTVRLSALGGGIAALRKTLAQGKREDMPIPAPKTRFETNAPTVSQPCLPALLEAIGEERMRIGRGLPLVCAGAPVRTLLVDPALLAGGVSFLRDCDLNPSTLSLAAYVSGYVPYALHEPWLWPTREPARRELARPSEQVLPGTTLARFEQLLGFRYGGRHPVGKAAMGLFHPEDTYAQRMPLSLQVTQRARAASMRVREVRMPLLVSAFVDLPSPAHSAAFYRLRFGFLRRVESLPLVMYTAGEQERALRAAFPNCQSYPERHLLPRSLLQSGMPPEAYFGRSKPLLVLRAAQRQPEFSHAAWLNMDVLPHPVCPQAVADFEPLMDDRVHLATVGGIPDGSFWVAPVKLLPAIARETLAITQFDMELKRGLDETLLWERLFFKHPDWFAIHRMPRRGLFFLSCFDSGLLSASLRAQLSDLPEPYLGEQVSSTSGEEKKDE